MPPSRVALLRRVPTEQHAGAGVVIRPGVHHLHEGVHVVEQGEGKATAQPEGWVVDPGHTTAEQGDDVTEGQASLSHHSRARPSVGHTLRSVLVAVGRLGDLHVEPSTRLEGEEGATGQGGQEKGVKPDNPALHLDRSLLVVQGHCVARAGKATAIDVDHQAQVAEAALADEGDRLAGGLGGAEVDHLRHPLLLTSQGGRSRDLSHLAERGGEIVLPLAGHLGLGRLTSAIHRFHVEPLVAARLVVGSSLLPVLLVASRIGVAAHLLDVEVHAGGLQVHQLDVQGVDPGRQGGASAEPLHVAIDHWLHLSDLLLDLGVSEALVDLSESQVGVEEGKRRSAY